MANGFEDFKLALRIRESNDQYGIVNSWGFLGAYQIGEACLVDIGWVKADGNIYDNNFSGGWTGVMGIDSKTEFLNSPAAQDAALEAAMELNWSYLKTFGCDDFIGQVVDGIMITASGLLAGAHLLGAWSVNEWLQSGGTGTMADQLGTEIEEYIELFAGYAMPFSTGEYIVYAEGGSGNDVVTGDEFDNLILGNGGDDTMYGLDGHDMIKGGAGNDLLVGGAGKDVLKGGTKADVLKGGSGADTLAGWKGKDKLYGGKGADTFVFKAKSGTDIVMDFEDDVDTLKLDDAIWGGGLSAKKLLQTFADDGGADVVFDFGDGLKLVVKGIENKNDLLDDIAIF